MTLLSEFWKAGGFKKASNLSLFLELVKSMMPTVTVNDRGEKVLSSANAGAMLVALIFFLLMYAIYRYGLQHGAPNGTPLRAVYIWDDVQKPSKDETPIGAPQFEASKVVADPVPFLDWAQNRGINQLWLNLGEYKGTSSQLIPLLAGAKNRGMTVQFVCMSITTLSVKKAEDNLEKNLSFISGIADKSLWPTGIQTNLEKGLKTTNANASIQYKMHETFIARLSQFNQTHGTQIRPVASVFYWWVNFEQPNAPIVNNMPYGDALLQLGFDVSVQDYRAPPLSLAKDAAIAWCERANKLGLYAYITLLVGPKGAFNYFDSMSNLEPDMQSIADVCMPFDSFAGMAVHDSLWYGVAFT